MHVHQHLCFCSFQWEDISFASSCWLVMLNISFPYTCHSYFFFWEMSIQTICPFLNGIAWFLDLSESPQCSLHTDPSKIQVPLFRCPVFPTEREAVLAGGHRGVPMPPLLCWHFLSHCVPGTFPLLFLANIPGLISLELFCTFYFLLHGMLFPWVLHQPCSLTVFSILCRSCLGHDAFPEYPIWYSDAIPFHTCLTSNSSHIYLCILSAVSSHICSVRVRIFVFFLFDSYL